MRDLTSGPVRGHILHIAGFIALTSLFQTLYFLVDLYFVGRLGPEAVAGVAVSGNVMMLVLAVTQTLGVGATSLLAQALGRRDLAQAERVLNQTMVLSTIVGAVFTATMFGLRGPYSAWLSADALTASNAVAYLGWFVPAMGLQFLLVGMGSALRGMGDMRVPTVISIGTILLNIVLTPALMFGWVTGHPLGVAGTALASFIAIVAGCLVFVAYFQRPSNRLHLRPALWRPDPRLWREMLRVGVPVGGEFALMTVYLVFVYGLLRPFGAAAQAGFGIGMRVMQGLFLPSLAIGFATAPVAAQNFGARLGGRVRESFCAASAMTVTIMILLTVLCQIVPGPIVRFFNADPEVVAIGSEYLRIISIGFVASGIIFAASSVFQGMGHTLPALLSSALRLVLFVVPAWGLSRMPGYQLTHLWYVALATVFVQMAASVWLLHREFHRKLVFTPGV